MRGLFQKVNIMNAIITVIKLLRVLSGVHLCYKRRVCECVCLCVLVCEGVCVCVKLCILNKDRKIIFCVTSSCTF
jgi:Mn2+/Fe2+ NRAMP family transporter